MATDLTQGAIWKKLLLFALPLLLSSLVQQLYNTVDLIFVGNFLGKADSSAVGASSLLITCLIGFFGGISVGVGVVVSQIFGAGDKEKLKKAVQNAIALSLSGGAILMLVGYFLAPLFLKWLNTPAELQADAVGYLQIYFLSFISIITYNLGAGVLRALGDAKAPLYAQLIGGVLNVVMDSAFVVVFDNGIEGVAWATLIAQSAAAAYIVYRMTKLDKAYALDLRIIRFDKENLIRVIEIGVPAGLQSLVITLSNVMAQYQINSLGVDAIAAFTAYFKVELLIYLPIIAFGQAIMTFSGQNSGAGNYKRIRQGTRVCLLMGIGVAVFSSALTLCFGSQLYHVFIKEPEVIDLGLRIIKVSFPFYFIYALFQVLGDSVRGQGKTNPPMIIAIINICVVRTIILVVIVPRNPDVCSVAMTYPITWALTAICMGIYYLTLQRRLVAVQNADQNEAEKNSVY